jgi:hypothetical protein
MNRGGFHFPVNPPQNAWEAVQQAQRNALMLRNLELQNRALEQEIRNSETQGIPESQTVAPAAIFSQPISPPDLETLARDARKAFNGYSWRALTKASKRNWSDNPKAVDRFYSKSENLTVPIEDAAEIVKTKR